MPLELKPAAAVSGPAARPIPRPMLVCGALWLAATLAVLVYGFRWAIFISPADAEQGNVGRIFFYHVPHSMLSLIFPYLNVLASIAFLYWRRRNPARALVADAWAVAAADIAVVYITISLVTGSLWGRAAWGIWWTWDARLTSQLLLWLLYVAYLLVRRLSSTGQTATVGAVLSIFAAIDVPIVFMSIRWWRTQHPAPVFGGAPGSGMDPSMKPAFYWNILAWFMWGMFILVFRFVLERHRQALESSAIESALNPAVDDGASSRFNPRQTPSPEAGRAF
jgi:heme exporter protein C